MASSYSKAAYRPRPARPNDDPAPSILAREFDGYAPRTHLACVCSIESGPCERVDVFHVSGRFWSTSACGEKRTPARPCFASMFVRQVRQCFSAVWADGFPRCRHRFPVM